MRGKEKGMNCERWNNLINLMFDYWFEDWIEIVIYMVFVIGCVFLISDLCERVIFLFGIDIGVFLCGNIYNFCI